MYDDIIINCAQVYRIDEKLIRAIIKKESSWQPYAYRIEPGFWKRYVSGIKRIFLSTPQKDEDWLKYPDIVSASYGLMQIMLSTAMEMGFCFTFPFELFDPATNIKWGCAYLRKLYDRYGTWPDAISAYNQGNNRKTIDGKYMNQKSYVDVVLTYWTEEG